MKFITRAPDCFTCFQIHGYDMPFTMACYLADHKGEHHIVMGDDDKLVFVKSIGVEEE